MKKFLSQLFYEIDDCEFNVLGRLAITLCIVVAYTLINKNICVVVPSTSFFWIMALGWVLYICLGICITIAGLITIVLVAGIFWIITGEYDEEFAAQIVIAPLKLLKFIFLFIFGDWDRFFWRKK